MYCKNCGKQIDDDSRFCQHCGTSFTGNSQEEPEMENAATIMPTGALPNTANLRLNDLDIKTLIRKHRGSSEENTPYFYGFTEPSMLLAGLIGVFSAAAYKHYILNFTKQGLHLYQIGVSRSLNIKNYSFIPTSDIKSVITIIGVLQWTVKIEYQQNGKIVKMKVRANKKIIGVKEQVPNLEKVRQMFDN